MPYVYLLHFEAPVDGKQHYIGSCNDMEKRMALHRAGRAAVLTRRLHGAGIAFVIANTWEFETSLEAIRAERATKRATAGRRCSICLDARRTAASSA